MFDGNRLIHFETTPTLTLKIADRITINLAGRRHRSSKQQTPSIADRILELKAAHKLTSGQFLDLVPPDWAWTIGTLDDPEELLRSLTADRLTWVANWFGVERRWLEGEDSAIYRWPAGYKQPLVFIQSLDDLGWLSPFDGFDKLRMTVLASDYRGHNRALDKFAIVFSYPIFEWEEGERVLFRHLVYDSLFDWTHPPCRIEAKALALWIQSFRDAEPQIPIVPVPRPELEAIASGNAFPDPFVPVRRVDHDHFEDRVLEWSPHALETHEVPLVHDYMEKSGLRSTAPQSGGT